MTDFETDTLKREIADEVKESLSRSTGKLITRRVLSVSAIIFLEVFLWILIVRSLVRMDSVADGFFVCWFVAMIRLGQVFAVGIFSEE